MSNWSNLNLSSLLPGQQIVPTLQSALDALRLIAASTSTILTALTGLVLPDTDPLVIAFQTAVNLFITTIQNLLSDTADAQIAALFALPQKPEEMSLYQRGFGGWTETVAGSFFDAGDVNRPQTSSSGVAGALLLAITAPDASTFLDSVNSFLRFFGRISRMQVPAPVSFRALLADNDGTPILDPVTILSGAAQPTTIRLEWEEPTFATTLLNLYKDQRVFIERSRSRDGSPVAASPSIPPSARDQRDQRPSSGYVEPQRDREGTPFYAWEPLDPATPAVSFYPLASPTNPNGYELDWIAGKYFLIIRNQKSGSDNAYYYRIRLVPEDVHVVLQQGTWRLIRNGAPYDGSLPSIPALATLPNPLPAFDFTNAFLNLYRIAHILRMDTTLLLTNGSVLPGANLFEPIPPSILNAEGFVNLPSAPDIRYLQVPMLSEPISFSDARSSARDPSTTLLGNLDPFAGQDEMFEALFGVDGAGALRVLSDRRALDFLSRSATQILAQDPLRNLFQTRYQAVQVRLESTLSLTGSRLDIEDVAFRSSISFLLSLFKGLAQSGRPPDWVNFRILADGFPDINEYLDLFLQFTNSLRALASTPADLLRGGQDALAQRLQFLSNILDQLEDIIQFFGALNQSISLLWIPPSVGGVERVVTEVLTATNPPATNADTFTGGVVLYLSGPSIGPIVDVLSLIFGV